MKTILLLISIFFSSPAFALTYEVIGACSEKPEFQGAYQLPKINQNVGLTSMEIFDRDKIPYIGAERGMNSILNTPTGEDSIEIISREEMYAYGWCFEVDGKQPEKMPDEVFLQGTEHLKWFYASSHYKRGEWLSFCDPAYFRKPKMVCEKDPASR